MNLLYIIRITWVINNTRSENGQPNMFLAIMIHQFGNYSAATLPFYITGTGRWILFSFNVIFVVCILLIFGFSTFTRKKEPKEKILS